MHKEFIKGKNGYKIPCLYSLSCEKTIVLISHGFGSSKESSTAATLLEAMPELGIGACAYDFPAHGDSPTDILRVGDCIDDLAAVEEHVLRLAPNAEIVYFSSSYGAYINLLYLAMKPHAGKKAFLRSAAVDMPELFVKSDLTPERLELLKSQGFFMMDDYFDRPLKITTEFCGDLTAYNVFELYKPEMAEIAMIHGTADEDAPLEDALRFAKQFGAEITLIEGADHRLMTPGSVEKVLQSAADFFLGS